MRMAVHSGKRILCLLLCLLVFASGLVEASATQPADNRTVKAGVFYFDGYHMEDESGNLTGYGIEFLNLVSQYSHLNAGTSSPGGRCSPCWSRAKSTW